MNPATSRPIRPKVFVYEHVCGGGMAGEPLHESWLVEGLAMLEAAVIALADCGCEIVTTCDARIALKLPASTIRIDTPGTVDDILTDLSQRTDLGLVIAPETGGILHRLTKLADHVPGWNLGSTADSVALCGDKTATARLLRSLNLPHSGTALASVQESPPREQTLYVVKPLDGAGTIDTYLVDRSKLQQCFARFGLDRSRFVIENHVPGISVGLSLLCDGAGEALPVAACEHDVRLESLEPGISRFSLDSGKPMADLHEAVFDQAMKAVRSVPGLRGWAGLDVILDPAGNLSAILEINSRLTSSFVWAINRTTRSEIVSQWLASSMPKRL